MIFDIVIGVAGILLVYVMTFRATRRVLRLLAPKPFDTVWEREKQIKDASIGVGGIACLFWMAIWTVVIG